jgi:hypothetical protein
MNKSELLTQLNNQIDCVFTLAQVKTMIEGLEQETTFDVDKVYKDIESRIQIEIEQIDDSDIANDDSFSFYLDDREVCIERVDINYAPIRRAVREGLNEWKSSLVANND